MPIFWKIVSTLKLSLNLYALGLVNDGASPNRKLFNLDTELVNDLNCDVVFKTINLFATSRRYIYFFADSTHLTKTARDCLYNSGSGSCSRLLWNNGRYLLFRHIADLFYKDQASALHVLPRLTLEHIVLTSYSKMKVKLATQVLSQSIAIVLEEAGDNDVLGTAEFCILIALMCDLVQSISTRRMNSSSLVHP